MALENGSSFKKPLNATAASRKKTRPFRVPHVKWLWISRASGPSLHAVVRKDRATAIVEATKDMTRQRYATKLIRALATIGAIFLSLTQAAAQSEQTVSVAYAGSLAPPMEGPIKTVLLRQGLDFQGQGGGSKLLANLIASGTKAPDVFISVDPRIVTGLGDKVDHATTFGSTSLGIAWAGVSRHAALFARVAAGKSSLIAALETPGLKIARTDPTLDPKGVYTLEAVAILAGAAAERRILGDPLNAAQIFPEEALLTRIELGQEDVGFFYKTEAVSRNLHFLLLPGPAALSGKITYTLAVLKAAPHPQQAKVFEDFVLTGQGKAILQNAGIVYFSPPRPVNMVVVR